MTDDFDSKPVGFIFVINLAQLDDTEEYELSPGMRLRKATETEIERIKNMLPRVVAPMTVESGVQWEIVDAKPLPRSQWRYFVITFEGSTEQIHRLQEAFDISPLELEFGMTIFEAGPAGGVMWTSARLFQALEHSYDLRRFFATARTEDLKLVSTCVRLINDYNSELLDVRRAIRQIRELKQLPRRSSLVFLGLFAILESLLTHEPRASDPYSSITRQVQTKLALLEKRFDRQIDYRSFGGASRDTIWTKMYMYRSRVAHGAEVNFTGDLKVLGSADHARALLGEVVKAVVRQALREPQLLADLRNC